MWHAHEIDMSEDIIQFKSLNANERHFLIYALAFFAASDGIVNENLAQRFSREIQDPEVRCFYGFQYMMENIHSETYAHMLFKLVPDRKERDHLFEAIETIPCIKQKAQWAQKWIEGLSSFAERLAAFAAIEGIFFSGSFCAIFWLMNQGKMPGLSLANQYIARDEGLHVKFACHLFSKLKYKLMTTTMVDLIRSAVTIEKAFVCDSLPVRLLGMNSDSMSQYIEFIADHLLSSLGYEKIFHVDNPYPFMEKLSLQGKTNFFEKRVSEYQKAGAGNGADEAFNTETEF